MNRIAVLPILLLTWSTTPGQSPVEVHPEAGDTLLHLVDNLSSSVELGYPGEEKNWDFTGLQSPFVRTHRYLSDDDGRLIIEQNDYTRQFVVEDGVLYLTALLDTDPLGTGASVDLIAADPLTEYNNPMEYRDGTSEFTRMSGTMTLADLPMQLWPSGSQETDVLRLVYEVSRDQSIDAYGTLLLQNHSFEVLRLYRTDHISLRIFLGNNDHHWTDVTSYFQSVLKDVIWERNFYNYHFVAEDLSGPVAVVHVNQYDEVQRVEYSVDPKMAEPIDTDKHLRGIYVYPNPTFGDVRFEFFQIPDGDYTLKVHNLLGKELWSTEETIESGKVILAELSFLSRGTYFYSLQDATGKRIVTRRLSIIKP